MKKSLSVLALIAGLVLGGFGVSYAYGTQNHTLSGVRHGCPFDNGCTGATNYYGDYIRNGYNNCYPTSGGCAGDNDMDTSYTAIYYRTSGTASTSNGCNNCGRVDVYWDTNPAAECYYRTTHSSNGPALSSHSHYTESAGTAACPL